MKVGDLVQLSAYGEARNQNYTHRGGWGIIVSIRGNYSRYPIQAHWYGTKGEQPSARFHPRELKKYKPDK